MTRRTRRDRLCILSVRGRGLHFRLHGRAVEEPGPLGSVADPDFPGRGRAGGNRFDCRRGGHSGRGHGFHHYRRGGRSRGGRLGCRFLDPGTILHAVFLGAVAAAAAPTVAAPLALVLMLGVSAVPRGRAAATAVMSGCRLTYGAMAQPDYRTQPMATVLGCHPSDPTASFACHASFCR